MERIFSVNLAGKVKNYSLSKRKALMPLFEAIINSINAIDERRMQNKNNNFKGSIIIHVKRSMQDKLPGVDNGIAEVDGFEIIDNGCGFNDENMESFLESDSMHKVDIGGKGIGRFSWLKAFKKVIINSEYENINGKGFIRRYFDFKIQNTAIEDRVEDVLTRGEYKTSVVLDSYLHGWKENVPKELSVIAMKIIHHCFGYFLNNNCPRILIKDDSESIVLNEVFNNKFKREHTPIKFKVKDREFTLLNFKIEEENFVGHELYRCAHSRVVDTKNLSSYIVDLNKNFYKHNKYWYIGVLTGEYLNDTVDMTRLSFDIPDNESTLMADISWAEIMEKVIYEIEKHLGNHLEVIKKAKLDHIKQFITKDAPQYKHLLKYMRPDIEKIHPGLTTDKMYKELDHVARKFEQQMKQEQDALIKTLEKSDVLPDDYEDLFKSEIEKITEANSSTLAKYVMHRNIIIRLFETGLRKTDTGKFKKEEYIHNLIYPQRKTSDDISEEAHNLWLIDERLSYCSYIASDIPFDKEKERPDILFMDRPFAVSDSSEERVYDSIIIIELKRPMRNNYTKDENPIDQLYGYVRKIRDGKAEDRYGRKIRVSESTKYYLYALCDDTSRLKEYISNYDFTVMPDNMGYYTFNKGLHAYCEILSFDKIIVDAKKRNRILFTKLGIH